MRNGTCSVPGCERREVAQSGYCDPHRRRVRLYGDPQAHIPLKQSGTRPCSVESCERNAHTKGLCKAHYGRLWKHGDVRADVPLAPRGGRCSVDGCDGDSGGGRGYCHFHYERWRRHGDANWQPTPKVHLPRLASNGYMTVWVNGKYELEHRLVWEREHGPLLPGQSVHHKNGDRTDNRPDNLELWDTSQPAGQRPKDKVEFAVEMLKRYAPELLTDMGFS